jgi:hypothetical protein
MGIGRVKIREECKGVESGVSEDREEDRGEEEEEGEPS